MRATTILLLNLLTSLPLIANANTPSNNLACLLRKPLIFGASISAGYSGLTDATTALVKLQASEYLGTDPHYLGANPDPITRLARKYNKNPKINNISEIINIMKHSSIGAHQFLDYISASPENLETARTSSFIASVDGLYWPTIYGDDCYWTEVAIAGTRDVIQFAKLNDIPILLGNVPNEDPSKVSLAVTTGGWSAPKFQCVEMVKRFLNSECEAKDQCYILDLHRIVEDLKGSNGPHDDQGIFMKGKQYEYNDFRKDGVHLYNDPTGSARTGKLDVVPNGIKYLMQYIEQTLAWSSPPCR